MKLTGKGRIYTIYDAYNAGLEEAWAYARKLMLSVEEGGVSIEVLNKVFDDNSASSILRRLSASMFISKLKEYEERQLEVGDEVWANDHKHVVTEIVSDDLIFTINWHGQSGSFCIDELKKTGKHYSQILEVLDELRGDEDDVT